MTVLYSQWPCTVLPLSCPGTCKFHVRCVWRWFHWSTVKNINRCAYCAFAPNIFGQPPNAISTNYKITNKRLLSCANEPSSCRICHYEVKCRKALWLQAYKALWSSCKLMQSSKHMFFTCVWNMNCCFTRCAANAHCTSMGLLKYQILVQGPPTYFMFIPRYNMWHFTMKHPPSKVQFIIYCWLLQQPSPKYCSDCKKLV